jgi:hypothetical protein
MPIFEIDVEVFDALLLHIIQFLCLGLAVFFGLRLYGKRFFKPVPFGLFFIATFLISSAVYDMSTFVHYDYQRALFQELPERVFQARYAFSFALRTLIIIVSLGLLRLDERCRKAIIGLAVFTIATIYWKHPFYVFENVAIMVERNYFGAADELRFPAFPWISMFVYVTADLLIAGFLIYYFTLQSVTRLYRKNEPTPAQP